MMREVPGSNCMTAFYTELLMYLSSFHPNEAGILQQYDAALQNCCFADL